MDVYTHGYLFAALDVNAIRWTKFKVVADYAHPESMYWSLLDKLQVKICAPQMLHVKSKQSFHFAGRTSAQDGHSSPELPKSWTT